MIIFTSYLRELKTNDQFSVQKIAVKVTKGQLSNGTISKNSCHEEYYLCGKFHGFMKRCTILPVLGASRYTILRWHHWQDMHEILSLPGG